MAPLREHRTRTRTDCRIPLECAAGRSGRPFQAVVHNISDDGAYLETDREIKRGDNIFIHALQQASLEAGCEQINYNAGMIRWSRAIERNGELVFGAGVRFFYPELMKEIEEVQEIKYFCDLCGKSLSIRSISRLQGPISMCAHCNDYIDRLPDKLYDTTTRYLMGNAL